MWYNHDCFSLFNQIYLDKESPQLSAFVCNLGLFDDIVMSMGLQGAPGTFQEFMNEVLPEEIAA